MDILLCILAIALSGLIVGYLMLRVAENQLTRSLENQPAAELNSV